MNQHQHNFTLTTTILAASVQMAPSAEDESQSQQAPSTKLHPEMAIRRGVAVLFRFQTNAVKLSVVEFRL